MRSSTDILSEDVRREQKSVHAQTEVGDQIGYTQYTGPGSVGKGKKGYHTRTVVGTPIGSNPSFQGPGKPGVLGNLGG